MPPAPTPSTPALEFAFLIKAAIGELRSGGMSTKGERLHIPITGGRVEGPRLSGSVLPGGSDWPLIRADGISEISARYSIETEDGALIEVRNDGLRVSSPQVLARLRSGEPVDPSEFYFRSAPIFLAPDGPHAWMNNSIFVASLCRDQAQVLIAVYRVT